MLKKILMGLIPVLALIGGAFGGEMLRAKTGADEPPSAMTGGGHGTAAEPAPQAHATAAAKPVSGKHAGGSSHGGDEGGDAAWFTFPTQFFVPLMRNGDMGAMMILTLTLETDQEQIGELEVQEHRLRDALLRQLMIAANTGGFDGNFTSEARLVPLREDLLQAAQRAAGPAVSNVLIEDIARQAS